MITVTAEIERASLEDAVISQSEADLIRVLLRRLRLDWPTRAIGAEVRSHGRCRTDVCVRVRDLHAPIGSDLLVGIEAKLTDWSRALRQAVLNRYAVNASMIAMPLRRISDQVLSAADEHGIGVLGVRDRSVSVILPATICYPDALLYARMNRQLEPTKARGRLKLDAIVRGSSGYDVSSPSGIWKQ